MLEKQTSGQTSGATGEKLPSWVQRHQRQPPDLAPKGPDVAMGVRFGVGVSACPFATPDWSSCFVALPQYRGSSLSSDTTAPAGTPAGRQVAPCSSWNHQVPLVTESVLSLSMDSGTGHAAGHPRHKTRAPGRTLRVGGRPRGSSDTLAGCVRTERESGSLLFPLCDSDRS